MKSYFLKPIAVLFIAFNVAMSVDALAEVEGHRLGIGVGLAQIGDSSHSYLSIAGEYEYRIDPYLGIGTALNYVFSDPSITLLAIPQGYFHPLQGRWYINFAPLFQFGGGVGTHLGARVGTRMPLELGVLSIIPQVNIDFINGGRNLIFGIGIAI